MSRLQGYTAYKYYAVTFPRPFVAHVEIDRADKLNAFHEAMWLELGRIFRRLSSDPDVRAVILSGAGNRAFTAGLDIVAAKDSPALKAGEGGDGARLAAAIRRHIVEFQASIAAVEKCEKPVIAVMHGICYGLAIDLSCCTDIRICTKDACFAVKEVDIGLAADIGTLSRLPKAVGSLSWVKEVCMTARDFSASEALAVGYVSQVKDSKMAALEAALDLGELLASKSPVAVQGTKELLNHARDHTVEDGLRYTAVWNSANLLTKDPQIALTSRIQKKTPTYEKL